MGSTATVAAAEGTRVAAAASHQQMGPLSDGPNQGFLKIGPSEDSQSFASPEEGRRIDGGKTGQMEVQSWQSSGVWPVDLPWGTHWRYLL